MMMMMTISIRKMNDADTHSDNKFDVYKNVCIRFHKSTIPEKSQMFHPHWKKTRILMKLSRDSRNLNNNFSISYVLSAVNKF